MEEDNSIRKENDKELNDDSSLDENPKNVDDVIARIKAKSEALKKLLNELKKYEGDLKDNKKNT